MKYLKAWLSLGAAAFGIVGLAVLLSKIAAWWSFALFLWLGVPVLLGAGFLVAYFLEDDDATPD